MDNKTEKLRDILDNITTINPSWKFDITGPDPLFKLRVIAYAPCTVTGVDQWQYGRWFLIEDDTDVRDVVRTAYQAAQLFMMHEFQETFKYKGVTVCDPHEMNIND